MERCRMEVVRFGSVMLETYRLGPVFDLPVASHVHEAYQLHLSPTNPCLHQYRGGLCGVPTRRVGVIHPGEAHGNPPHEICETVAVYQVLYLPPEWVAGVAAEAQRGRLAAPFIDHETPDARLGSAFVETFAALTGAVPATLLEKEGMLLRLTQAVLGQGDPYAGEIETGARRRQGRSGPVRRAQELLNAHFAREVSLTELTAVAGVSPSYLCRAFQREVGVSPHRYQVLLRVDQARRLLAGGTPPGEAAARTGFTHQSHLGVHFKRVLRTTPGEYARCVTLRPARFYPGAKFSP